MLSIEGVGKEVGERFRGFEGGHSRQSFRRVDLERGLVRSGCALQPSRDEAPVSPGGEPPRARQDSLAQHISQIKVLGD